MQRRPFITALGAMCALDLAHAHHGWSSFDQERPIYLEGTAHKVKWQNPHVEIDINLPSQMRLPTDLAQRVLPAQAAPVDGKALLAKASLPTRADKRWELELAPLTRVQAWGVPEVKVGTPLAVLGFTFAGEKGATILRVEYLWLGGKTYALRSSPV